AATAAISQQVTTALTSTGALAFRVLQTARTAQIYDPVANVIATTPVKGASMAQGLGMSLDNMLGMSDLRPLVRAAANGSIQNVRLLPQQTLGSATVDV